MDDDSVTDRLKRRFYQFGEFFKGFLKSEQGIKPSSTLRADQQVYDDTPKYHYRDVLEFDATKMGERNSKSNSQSQYSSPGSENFYNFFGNTRSLFEEFEQTMKIFDDFAFILQQPKFGHPPGVGGLGSDSDHVIASDDLENEQDARYYKFFGRQMPSLYPTEETDKESVGHGEAEENYRDLMLKPSPNEKHGNRNIQSSTNPSVIGSILDSFWGSGKSADHNHKTPTPSSDFVGTGSYFTFSSEESSLKSDGFKVTVNSTKIRETPEGREIITHRTDENGVTEEIREFIPRKDIPQQNRNPLIGGGTFRPRL